MSKAGGIAVYPNPFTTQTIIEIKEFRNTKYELRILDLLGREILKSVITSPIFAIDRGELKAGTYFLQVISEKEIIGNEKIVIQ